MTEPQVYLVGAGPGHPGYLTLRAVECLARADLVLYDRLVATSILEHAPRAERICVNELASAHIQRSREIHKLMIDRARAGQCVVRLKGGDPHVFGRAGEEAEALSQAGISYEIVPGVTAILGAAACTGIPLTHRAHASGFVVVTGHEDACKGESAVDWAWLARFPGTLIVYMGMAHLEKIVNDLLAHGKGPDTPAAAVHWATTNRQRTVVSTLAGLPAAVQDRGLAAPALLLIGPVVSLRERLDWFEKRPLFQQRILVTRPRHQVSDLVHELELAGATPLVLPAVAIQDPPDWSVVDRALRALGSYQWLVFTSANGVDYLLGRLGKLGLDLRQLGGIKLAAIGPATAEALARFHLRADLVPAEYRSETLAAELKEQVRGQRVLLARADRGRELLRDELQEVAQVEQIAVYSQVDALDRSSPEFAQVCRGEIDWVTLTSSNIARAVLGALDEPARAHIKAGRVRLASISPVTSATIAELGLPVHAEAKEYTSPGLVAALVRANREGG